MALRCVTEIADRAVFALRLTQRNGLLPIMSRVQPTFSRIPMSAFHTHQPLCVLDKDVRQKKDLIKMAQSEKMEASFVGESDLDLSGLTEAGITIPTLETHAMIIDGVRYDQLPIAHIQSTPNNTIITVTDYKGTDILGRSSCGQEGFKNVKKSTSVAAQATGLSLGTKMMKKNVQTVRVLVKGLGVGRLASIKGLQMAGIRIVSITDGTPVLHEGPRPRKAKRL